MLGTDWYKRWRHARGFGIHSPSAYRLVREVLRPGSAYAYYAYEDIGRARRALPNLLSQNELELIFRLLLHFRPASVCIPSGPSSATLEFIVKTALPGATLTTGPAEMAIVEGRESVPPSGATIVYFTDSSNPSLATLADTVTTGHILRNPTRALVITTPRLPKQTFQISF